MNVCTISDENNPLSQTIPDAPTELKFFIKLCEQRRKFPVLYKIEFTVSLSFGCTPMPESTRKVSSDVSKWFLRDCATIIVLSAIDCYSITETLPTSGLDTKTTLQELNWMKYDFISSYRYLSIFPHSIIHFDRPQLRQTRADMRRKRIIWRKIKIRKRFPTTTIASCWKKFVASPTLITSTLRMSM